MNSDDQKESDRQKLMSFYGVDTKDELIDIQAGHIERLQAELLALRSPIPPYRKPRQG